MITIQTSKPVCLQMKGHRDFSSLAISWRGRVGLVPESTCSHKSLRFLPLAALRLQCSWPIPCQLSAFEGNNHSHTFPPRQALAGMTLLCYRFWAPMWDSLLAFVTLILSLKPRLTFWQWSLMAAAGFWPLHRIGVHSIPLLDWLCPEAVTAFRASVQRAWDSTRPGRLCAMVSVATKNPQKGAPKLETILWSLPLPPHRLFL